MLTVIGLGAVCVGRCGEPRQKLELTVTNEAKEPMQGVECKAWLNHRGTTSPLATYVVTGKSDEHGVAELIGKTIRYQTVVAAEASGYHRSTAHGRWASEREGSRWLPWPVKVNLTMKKKVNPHPMYALKMLSGTPLSWITFPKSDAESFGFDLIARDWVKPYGKGEVADFVLSTKSGAIPKGDHLPAGNMSLSFSNPADGIVAAVDAPAGGSDLISPVNAPESGYSKEVFFSNHPRQDGLFPGTELSRRVWVFRVRTKLDNDGKLISAQYGKIQGHPQVLLFSQGHAFRMTYYLNAKKNDRNLEWDRKNNLFKDLETSQWPEAP